MYVMRPVPAVRRRLALYWWLYLRILAVAPKPQDEHTFF